MKLSEKKEFWLKTLGFQVGNRVRVKRRKGEGKLYYEMCLKRGLKTGIIVSRYYFATLRFYWIVKLDRDDKKGERFGAFEDKDLEFE